MAEPGVKPKILFVINSLMGGGAERVMSRLLSHTEQWTADYDIALALLDEEPVMHPVPSWVAVHQLSCRHRTGSSLAQLRKLVGTLEPQVTLSFLTRSNIAAGFAALGRDQPWIISERINTSAHLGRGLRAMLARALVRATYPRASRVIAVASGVGTDLVERFQISPDMIEVIPNPVDVHAIKAAAAAPCELWVREPYVLALGRLVPSKNHELLVRAFAGSEFEGRLIIAGEGPERARIQSLAAELGIGDRVMLPGFLANPYPALARAHVFALSSNVEGFPNALVEALALEVPVVATNCPDGPAEILAGRPADQLSGRTVAEAGILAPVGEVGSYAWALDRALDPRVRARIIAGGAERVRSYSPELITARYRAVIEDVLARPAPARSLATGGARQQG